MRIAIDAVPLCYHSAGIPRALRETLQALQYLDQENDYYLYSKYDFTFPFENPRWHKRVHPRTPFLLGSLYLEDGMKSAGGGRGLDVFWATRTYPFPFGLPSTAARIVTIHDLVWLLYPETMAFRHRVTVRLVARATVRRADRIIAVSESTRQGLVEMLGTAPEKIEVVHHGVNACFALSDRRQAAQWIAEKYRVSPNYLCTVGTVEPRKNIVTLIEALRILRERGQWRHQLLVAGASGWKNSDIYGSVRRSGLSERDVTFLGPVSDEDLAQLYAGAALFVFPSLYEGFGLPLLEAMASGTPVVASNTSSVPEVVQEAGLLVSPRDPAELADAIAQVTADAELSRSLQEKGLARARQFTWEAAARKVRRIVEEAVQAKRRPARRA